MNEVPKEFDQILVDHAVRCWDAQRENANRLSSRATLILSALAALFGLGLFRIDWFRSEKDVCRVHSLVIVWTIKALLSLGLFMFGVAFFRIMGRRGKRLQSEKAHSADLMSLPEAVLTSGAPKGDEARRLVFIRVYRAYIDLRERNASRRQALDRGQLFFLSGLICIGIALLMYILWGEPPKVS